MNKWIKGQGTDELFISSRNVRLVHVLLADDFEPLSEKWLGYLYTRQLRKSLASG